MQWLKRNKYRLHYVWDGNPDAPVLLMSHSLGSNISMWDHQVEILKKHFHLLRYDHPGHGRSDSLQHIPTIEDLGLDVLALIDELGLEKTNFCGLSLGGMVGMWLGAHAPQKFSRIVVSSTAAKIENPDLLRSRLKTIRSEGLSAISDSVITKWFTPEYIEKNPQKSSKALAMFLTTKAEGYAALAETVCDLDLRDEIKRITIPFLIMYGHEDKATPPSWNKYIHEMVQNSSITELHAAHMANIEAADRFSENLVHFLCPGY
jgi:3-oxoadipate enol-lactonase